MKRLDHLKVHHKTHTKLKARVHKRDNYTCKYCGKNMLKKYTQYLRGIITRKRVGLTVDHVKPLSKGGTWSMGNLVTCCVECNAKKANNIWNQNTAPDVTISFTIRKILNQSKITENVPIVLITPEKIQKLT